MHVQLPNRRPLVRTADLLSADAVGSVAERAVPVGLAYAASGV